MVRAPRNQYTILIIDNLRHERETYRRYLAEDQDYDYTMIEEASISGGVAVCRSQSVDAILVNEQLPDADGVQLLPTLKQQSGIDSPPIVVVAELGDEATAVRAIKSGAEDYLLKDRLTPDILRGTMRTAIANRATSPLLTPHCWTIQIRLGLLMSQIN